MGGTPKWMVYNGTSIYKWMIWGYRYFRQQNGHEIEKESRVFFATGSWEEEQQMGTRMRSSKLLKSHFLGKQMFLDDGFRTGIWQNYIWSSKVSNYILYIYTFTSM